MALRPGDFKSPASSQFRHPGSGGVGRPVLTVSLTDGARRTQGGSVLIRLSVRGVAVYPSWRVRFVRKP